jgi:hypothetical protein
VLKRKIEPKREEETGRLRKLNKENIHNFHSTPYITWEKEDELGGHAWWR